MRCVVISPIAEVPVESGVHARILRITDAMRSRGWDVRFVLVAGGQPDLSQLRARYGEVLVVLPPRSAKMNLVRFGNLFLRAAYLFRSPALVRAVCRLAHPLLNRPPAAWLRPEWKPAVRQVAEAFEPDVVLGIYAANACLFDAFPQRTVRVVDTIDILADRYLHYVKAQLPVSYYSHSAKDEVAALAHADLVIGIQESDSAHFRRLGHRGVLTLNHLPPPTPVPACAEPTLLFVGSNFEFNVQAIEAFLPHFNRVRARVPDAKLLIAGSICDALRGKSLLAGVEMVGRFDLPENLYARAAIALNPVVGGTGQNIKVVEAIAFGVPMITLPHGVRGWAADDVTRLVQLVHSVEEMADRCAELLSDRRRLAACRAQAIEAYAPWQAAPLDDFFARVTALVEERRGARTFVEASR